MLGTNCVSSGQLEIKATSNSYIDSDDQRDGSPRDRKIRPQELSVTAGEDIAALKMSKYRGADESIRHTVIRSLYSIICTLKMFP